MAFSYIIAGIFALSVLVMALSPTPDGGAMLSGAQEAVSFCISISGSICLWSAVMELAERCGVTAALGRMLRGVLHRLFPDGARDGKVLDALTENVTANLLGLGNAATPAGIRAAQGMARGGMATDELCLLVVINTASIQLVPTTVAAVRAACGASAPFDIMPAVWISSLVSLCAALAASAWLKRLWQ